VIATPARGEDAGRTSPASDTGAAPQPQPDLTAETLRDILFQRDRQRITGLEGELDDLARRLGDEEALAAMVAPVLGDAIRRQIRDAREEMIESLYPIIGQVVVRAVSEAFRDLARSVDAQMRNSLNPEAIFRRWRARLGGVSDADAILRAALLFSVAEVFLIHRETGLLLRHLSRDARASADSDLISGMLTAIRDFAQDAFGRGEEGQLDEIQYGDRRILVEAAQHAYLAVVVDGVEPPGFRTEMRERIIEIEHTYDRILRHYDGDSTPLAPAEESLKALVEPAKPVGLTRTQKRLLVGLAALVAACMLLSCMTGAWIWQVARGAPAVVALVPTPTISPSPAPTDTPSPSPTFPPTATPVPPTLTPTRTAASSPTTSPAVVTVPGEMTGSFWVRVDASVDSPRLGMVLEQGRPVEILARSGDWYRVRWVPRAQAEVVGWVPVRWVSAAGLIPAQMVTPAAGP